MSAYSAYSWKPAASKWVDKCMASTHYSPFSFTSEFYTFISFHTTVQCTFVSNEGVKKSQWNIKEKRPRGKERQSYRTGITLKKEVVSPSLLVIILSVNRLN